MKKTVQVLMSSYNGEKYICEQLDSILMQQQVEVKLLIRDDGSSDGTLAILQAYAEKNENVQVVYGENIGAIKSFFELIQQADDTVDYYAFSDQDDIWFPEKLYRAVSLLQREERIPLVYCSGQILVDENGTVLPKAIQYQEVCTGFGNALVENMCTGCTCVMNRELISLLKGRNCEFTIMHDFWIYLLGTCFGKVIYDRKAFIKYRQHSRNALGSASTRIENYKRRIANFKKHRWQLTDQAKAFFKEYEREMPADKKELLNSFVNCKKNWKDRWTIAFNKKVFRQRKIDNIIMKILVLFGLV